MTLAELLKVMQDDIPRVKREAARRKNQPHHKSGHNRSNNSDAEWLPDSWIVPTAGTNCGGRPPHLYEEGTSDW